MRDIHYLGGKITMYIKSSRQALERKLTHNYVSYKLQTTNERKK